MNTVRMTHPLLPGQHYDAPESAVDIHRHSGWQTEDDVARAKAAETPATKPDAATTSPASRAQRTDTSSKE